MWCMPVHFLLNFLTPSPHLTGCGAGNKPGLSITCPKCKQHFCLDCDIYIHESLHNCPGCESLRHSKSITAADWLLTFHSGHKLPFKRCSRLSPFHCDFIWSLKGLWVGVDTQYWQITRSPAHKTALVQTIEQLILFRQETKVRLFKQVTFHFKPHIF